MKILAVLASFAMASAGLAASPPNTAANHYRLMGSSNTFNLLEGVALNTSAGTRTITLDLADAAKANKVEGFGKIRVAVFFTYAAATTVTAQFTCSLDGTNYGRTTSRSTSAGASTVSLQSDTYTTGAANANLILEYDVRGCRKAQVLFGGASAGASDLVNVQAVAVAGV